MNSHYFMGAAQGEEQDRSKESVVLGRAIS